MYKKGVFCKNCLDEKSKLLHYQDHINKVYSLAGECFCKFFGNTCTEQINHYFSVLKKTNRSILDLFIIIDQYRSVPSLMLQYKINCTNKKKNAYWLGLPRLHV